MSKRRGSTGDLFKCPISHVTADDVRIFFHIQEEGVRGCTLCKCTFKIADNDKTTSSLRTHLKTKHTKEVLIKHPSPNLEAESKTKMSKLFDPYSVRTTQEKYDKACLLKFIANAESFSSLGNQGKIIICILYITFNSSNAKGNVLFHQMMFPDLIQPNKNLIKFGAVNLWNIIKPKLEEYISTHASDSNDITSTLDIWSDDGNQSFLGVTIHFLTKSWILESFSIALKPLFESHTSENIASWLTSVYAQWKINPWLRINDGASNMSEALSKSLEKLFQSYVICVVEPTNFMVFAKTC
jgi:hypothetical protein